MVIAGRGVRLFPKFAGACEGFDIRFFPPGNLTSIPVGLTDFYTTTLVFTITATGQEYGEVNAGIDLSSSSRSGAPPEMPLPAAVWMMGSVLAGGIGVGRWRKRRKIC